MSFDGIDSIFASKLRALLESRKAEITEQVTCARGVSDYASYQRLVGHIAGLDECLGMFQTVAARLEEEGKRR